MPIMKAPLFIVVCDASGPTLGADTNPHVDTVWPPHVYLTPTDATGAAILNGWTITPSHSTCPSCFQTPTPN